MARLSHRPLAYFRFLWRVQRVADAQHDVSRVHPNGPVLFHSHRLASDSAGHFARPALRGHISEVPAPIPSMRIHERAPRNDPQSARSARRILEKTSCPSCPWWTKESCLSWTTLTPPPHKSSPP